MWLLFGLGNEWDSFIKQADAVTTNIQNGFNKVEEMIATFSKTMAERVARMKSETVLATNIISNTTTVANATPRAKGYMLYQLSQFDPIIFEQHLPEVPQAILHILNSIDNATEFLQVLICIVDKDSSGTVPASQGAKQLVANLGIDDIVKVRAAYIRVLNITQSQIIQSTDTIKKNDLLAAYQSLLWDAEGTVFIKDNKFRIDHQYQISASNKPAFAARMKQPNLIH